MDYICSEESNIMSRVPLSEVVLALDQNYEIEAK